MIPWGLVLRIVGPLALAGGAWWWVDSWLDGRDRVAFERGQGEVQQRWDRETAQRAEIALLAEKGRNAKEATDRAAKENDNAEQARLAADLDAARTAAGTAGEQLRIALNTLRSTAAGGGAVPDAGTSCRRADAAAATAFELFERCAERRDRVGEEAGSLAAQVIGLQGFARRAQALCGERSTSH